MTLFQLAERYVGVKELSGGKHHPLVSWWLSLCGFDLTAPDEIPWCSAFVNGMAWELRLARSKSARARSWLTVGMPVLLHEAKVGFDVVILKRGPDSQPPASVIDAPGHVGIYAGRDGDTVLLLSGNQTNSVSIAPFPVTSILGIRRLLV